MFLILVSSLWYLYSDVWQMPPATKAAPPSATSWARSQAAAFTASHWEQEQKHEPGVNVKQNMSEGASQACKLPFKNWAKPPLLPVTPVWVVCVCVCVCVCVWLCSCVLYIFLCVCVTVCMCDCVCKCMYVCVIVYVCVIMCMCVIVCVIVCVCACVCITCTCGGQKLIPSVFFNCPLH